LEEKMAQTSMSGPDDKGNATLDSKQRENRKRKQIAESPWAFSDLGLELLYKADHRDCLCDRARPFGQIQIIVAWLFKIPFYYSQISSGSTWTLGELWTAVVRQALLIFFTIMVALNFESETKKVISTVLIWISRVIILPLHLFQETGVPLFSTELIAAQVGTLPVESHFFRILNQISTQFMRIFVGAFFSPTFEEHLASTVAIVLVRPVSLLLLGSSCPMDRSGAICGAAETLSLTIERALFHAAGGVIVYFLHLDRRRAWLRARRAAAAAARRPSQAAPVALQDGADCD
jgi:hypothetical protein